MQRLSDQRWSRRRALEKGGARVVGKAEQSRGAARRAGHTEACWGLGKMPRNAPACQRVYDMGRQADPPPRKASMIGKRSLPVAALMLCAACGGTSAAANLIERHVVAVGGRERLEAIHSLQIIGILNERGTLHPMFIDRRRPNLLRVRMLHGGELVFTEAYTGSRSWEGPPGKEECTPGPAAAAATRHAAEEFDDPPIPPGQTGATVRIVGRGRRGGGPPPSRGGDTGRWGCGTGRPRRAIPR